MLSRLRIVVGIACLGATASTAQFLREGFVGPGLSDKWSWANEDDCAGVVKDGLALNPQSGCRQSAIGTTKSIYSWVPTGNSRNYQFTIADWKITTNSHVSARLFLVGNDAGPQPEAFSDFNKPNVIMAKLDLFEGAYYWNLYVKTNAASKNADGDEFKRSWLDVGATADGCTFGLSLNRGRARLWWQDAAGVRAEAGETSVPVGAFSKETTFYVGVKNDTGAKFDSSQTVTISKVAITP